MNKNIMFSPLDPDSKRKLLAKARHKFYRSKWSRRDYVLRSWGLK